VKIGRLASSLLVVIDCSKLAADAIEDLFMNSRDRLSNGDLRKAIEEQLEDVVGSHPGLKELREARRRQEISEKLDNARPLEDVLGAILKSSPSLSQLFLVGSRLSKPHPSPASNGNAGGQGTGGGPGEFKGQKHPSFFHPSKLRPGQLLDRTFEIGRRCRVKFETDVENDYFGRAALKGRYFVELLEGPFEREDLDNSLTLHDGTAYWSINIPEDKVNPGDQLTIQCSVNDDVISEPFVNIVRLRATAKAEHKPTDTPKPEPDPNKGHDKPGGKGTGQAGNQGASGPAQPDGIKLPDIVEVEEGDANWVTHGFNPETACKVIEDGTGGEAEGQQSIYTFYVNVDNLYLRTDMKTTREDVALQKAKFKYGNVLVGLALIQEWRSTRRPSNGNGEDSTEPESMDVALEKTTRALAPFLVPMIDYLGSLTTEELEGLAKVGDDD
jgi:hypothetical protein